MASPADNASTLHAGELEIRLGEGLVLATGRALTLSVREFELLAAMARRTGAIVGRDELYSEVWKGELRQGDRSVDVYVSKLRGKLEAAMPDRRFIHTHPGFGYRFQPQPAREPSGVTLSPNSDPHPSPDLSDDDQRERDEPAQTLDGLDGLDAPAQPLGERAQTLSQNVHIEAVGSSRD